MKNSPSDTTTGLMLLLGAEINSTIESVAAEMRAESASTLTVIREELRA